MDIGPIWRAMLRNKSGFVLIALQIAVTLTIMVNAFGIIQERAGKIERESGMDEANTFAFASVLFMDYERDQRKALIDEDLDLIRNTPGVVNAIASNSFPLRQGGWSMSLALEPGSQTPESVGTAIYFVDEHGVETFDVTVIDGKNFTPDQVTWSIEDDNTWPAYGLITEALAKELWPDETGSVVGKTAFINDNDPVTVVGVIDRLQAPWQGWSGVEKSMLVPQRRPSEFVRYIVRAEPGMRDELMPEIEARLAASNKDRIVRDMVTMDQTHGARHRRAGEFQCQPQDPPDRHPAGTGGNQTGHRALLPDREHHRQRDRAWHRCLARDRSQHRHGRSVFARTAGLVRDTDRHARSLGRRPTGRDRAGAAGEQHHARDRDAFRLARRYARRSRWIRAA
ncbi:MAG: ABC transporter permease [Woeseiaceae bacterium]